MEYIQGAQPITTYVSKSNLGTRERLALFMQACEAVHHGHQKGIIHRDLKPANILVDSLGQVKVIDFGVARATDSDVAVTTMQTDVGSLIGTLQYMSPEQCEADPLGLDIRSDVYSLGVILYELLIGQLPYNVAGRPIPSATRTICESEPTRPSTIDRKIRGDLEIIVLTAMEKERPKRYQSAGGLAADIRRYLQHEPISAKPRSRWTKIVHWVGRHPRLATTAVCILIAAGIVGGTASTVSIMHHPSRVTRSTDASAAFLHSVTGRVLHEWPPTIWHPGRNWFIDKPNLEVGASLRLAILLRILEDVEASSAFTISPGI
jgi:serine/threonine protein kinase